MHAVQSDKPSTLSAASQDATAGMRARRGHTSFMQASLREGVSLVDMTGWGPEQPSPPSATKPAAVWAVSPPASPPESPRAASASQPEAAVQPAAAPWLVGFAGWLGAKLGLTYVPRDYAGRWALITGASSGIGACFAEELARRGAHVMLTARSEDKLNALATRLSDTYGVRAEIFVADLTAVDATAHLLQDILDRGLRIDVLVNNAGLAAYGRSEVTDPARQHAILQINVVAATELAQACLPAMRASGEGTILNMASIAAFVPMPYLASYAATKAYLLSFSEGLWAENRETGVRVIAVCPGATDTAFFDAASWGNPEAAFGNLSTPQSVVDASFKAIDQDRSYVICNVADYWKMQSLRCAPRGFVASCLEEVFKPGRPPSTRAQA